MKKRVDILTRVEGEGKIIINEKDGKIESVVLNIFEPPRFIEGILVGRKYDVIPDITARICGICPVAYQMSGVQAIESAFGIDVSREVEKLRKLYYYGEWIQSHSIHVFFLHLPDFYGKSSIFEIAKERAEILKDALRIKSVGGKIVEIIGGRVVHPVSVKAGGFTRYPEKEELKSLIPLIEESIELAKKYTEEFSKLNFPEDNIIGNLQFVSLYGDDEYAILNGRIVSDRGLDIDKDEFKEVFKEFQVGSSTAKKCRIYGKNVYIVGAMSRFNNNYEKLSDEALRLSKKINLSPPVKNSFKSILVRMVEIVHSMEKAIEIIKTYEKPEVETEFKTKRSEGTGVSEAPRGVLWHKYSFDEYGIILSADIVPPTSQNQDIMEINTYNFIKFMTEKEKILTFAERVVRNYDPCISCATHLISLD